MFRREGKINQIRLNQAELLSFWGLPLLVVIFVVTYWVMGIFNYISPNIETIMQKEKEDDDEGGSLFMILMILALGSSLLMICGWFLYPKMIVKKRELKENKVVQSIN